MAVGAAVVVGKVRVILIVHPSETFNVHELADSVRFIEAYVSYEKSSNIYNT